MKRNYMKLLVGTIATTIVLVGCGNTKTGTYDNEGQVFRKNIPQDMSSLDTALVTDQVSFDTFNQVYEGLYTLDKDDHPVPGVAKADPKKSNGGKTLTIELRKDAKWSNGDSVTAHDFVFAWQKVVDPKTAAPYAYIMYDIKNAQDVNESKKDKSKLGVKALDDYTLQIDLEKPIPYFQSTLAFGAFMPQNEKVVKKYGERYGTTAEKTVYNGPFEVDKWAIEDKILLKKNPEYWDKKHVHLDRVNYKILKDTQAGAALYDTESVDDTLITAEQVNKYKGEVALQFRLVASTFFLKMNQDHRPEFKNKHLRSALAKSINKQNYVDKVLNNGSASIDVFTSKETIETPDGEDYAEKVKTPLKYNVKEAQADFEKAKKELGKEELTFALLTDDTPSNKISAEFLKSQMETNLKGLKINIKQVPFKQRVNLEHTQNYDISISGWSPDYSDPLSFLEIMTTGNANNNTGWSNKTYDNLLKEANTKLLTKPKERMDKLREAEELLLDDAAIAPIYQKGEAHLTNPQVKGLIYHKIGGDTTLKHVYIDKSIDRNTGKKK